MERQNYLRIKEIVGRLDKIETICVKLMKMKDVVVSYKISGKMHSQGLREEFWVESDGLSENEDIIGAGSIMKMYHQNLINEQIKLLEELEEL